MPGIGGNHYQYVSNIRHGQQPLPNPGYPGPSASDVYSHTQRQPSTFSMYVPTASQNQLSAPLAGNLMSPQAFSSQQSPISSQFNSATSQQASSLQNLTDVLHRNLPVSQANPLQSPFNSNPFDQNDPTQYNFDPASFNFGNHYGALEFGMLGHMSSGAAETPPSDTSLINQSNGASYTTPGTRSTTYSDSPVNVQPYLFTQDQKASDWQNGNQKNVRQGGASGAFSLSSRNQDTSSEAVNQIQPHAFTIGAGASNLTSPSSTSSPQGVVTGFDDSPIVPTLYSSNSGGNVRPSTQDRAVQQRNPQSILQNSNFQAQSLPTRRTRDPSTIYESVKQPYSYTTGFHGLTAFLQRRFSPQKTLRIAKALASIRPSFISCTKALNREDLIFMEKCFQRTLWEYEEFINACGTPTIVCRRTGEVAAVGKEFSILTGWKKDILLGNEPNLNVNTDGTSGQPGTGTSSRGGMNTPRMPEGSRPELLDPARPQPVFLAELLDDDSVIEFYEDFARLAFGDSRGSVTTRCKLLKYKTKNDSIFTPEAASAVDDSRGLQQKRKRPAKPKGKGDIASEARIDVLGDKDGKVECSYCWTVKRDVFDIPMLIVMNVSLTVTFQFLETTLILS